ncbi:phosphoenolpyruvate--protein phosphotransferase [Pelagibaculum spongiae]|uniref:phosphoenolpyruvate--protein phosphotransferase n=1 Tax=Pelagibaculum spongiae TaxID=2080658 RepID=A0A2V1H568_9GAMM|nr:phosphoenolpyruvate--protein phosphotransferase [Pelagibaculum spongiae]PVZ72398.1 phosphoenolpyruvate-protein phosphotransferase PtsP [Pelagibaculum spongiae]
MLQHIRQIVQEVNRQRDTTQVLNLIVERLQQIMETDVCSIYITDPQSGRHILKASRGLKQQAVGRISLDSCEGLVGLVAQKAEPVNLDDASQHACFRYFPETGEEAYSAFLGVPISFQRRNLGVLVVQQGEERRFDEEDEALLVTVSAQLSAVLGNAEASGLLSGGAKQGALSRGYKGRVVSPGLAIGRALVVYPPADLDSVPEKGCENPAEEILAFRDAVNAVQDDIRQMSRQLEGSVPKAELVLFDAYITLLSDPGLNGEIEQTIRKGNWAQGALKIVVLRHASVFETMEDDYLRERAVDLLDLGRRVLSKLQVSQEAASRVQREYPKNTILVGDEVTAAMLARVPVEKLCGVVSVKGSSNSHTAILARSLGIPVLMGMEELPFHHLDGQKLALDAYRGKVYPNPPSRMLDEYRRMLDQDKALSESLNQRLQKPALSPDGRLTKILINTGLASEQNSTPSQAADGVGLYRTELPFMMRNRFPSENEQQLIYRQLLEGFSGRPVIMRTLDIGGDKNLPYFPIVEDNPFLGWRGVRVTLDHPEIFLGQLRAMIKANQNSKNLMIMFPMITHLQELKDCLKLFEQAWSEVSAENTTSEKPELEKPKVGMMIEVPAAVYQIHQMAALVDFVSVGSNDLSQYLMAVDRNNSRVSNLCDHLTPSLLMAMKQIVDGAHAAGATASVCGEMAGDPYSALLLSGMGYDSLSMNAVQMARVKWALQTIPYQQLQSAVDPATLATDANQVRQQIRQLLIDNDLKELVIDKD